MENDFDANVLNWYRQYAHEKSENDDHTSPNFLTRIDENDISKFESEFGNIIPDLYIKFLIFAGDGRIRRDIHGNFNEFNDNSFLNTTEISEILRKNSAEWDVYPDFIADNEIPFFYISANAVLVFRKNEGSKVYHPHLDVIYAENFGEFLRKLMNNINFYTEL
ncbi:SMI1/KNR4 family protein [Rhizobium herbae]|uniref:SMI1/KNR4 family protein n=1 Tax=Rhizobium herbae TaxID=508661 RepID=A0ABS7H9M8_9HYPH|nr:SMI1/KNR4 family protein [Rhizobium herbae]MBW9063982.1 SMI1/KNR4 family protein [Rhizobium herbae]